MNIWNLLKFLIAFYLLVLPASLDASTYQINISATSRKVEEKVIVDLKLVNKGNAIAKEVSVDFFHNGKLFKKEEVGELKPNVELLKKNIELSLIEILHGAVIPCLLTYVTVQNVKNTSPFLITVDQNSLDPYLKVKTKEVRIADFAHLNAVIENQGLNEKHIFVRLLVPEEFDVLEDPPNFLLYPQKERKIKIKLMNKWSNPGSSYPAYILLEDQWGKIIGSSNFEIKVISYQEMGWGYLNLLFALLILVGIWEASKGIEDDH